MPRILVCVFTYNRARFLLNAARSIDTFFPWGDRLVIDDGSTDPGVAAVLGHLRGLPRWRVRVMDRRLDRTYGGFYYNMSVALRTALDEGYDYCFFFEDDEQLVWRKDDYPARIQAFFAGCPDAVMLQPMFFRRVINYAGTIEYVAPSQAYRTNRGFNTTVFWNLSVVRRYPDYELKHQYGDGLPANSAYWLARGYRLYIEHAPTVAILPWVQSRLEGSTGPDLLASAGDGDFLLRSLSAAEVERLRGADPAVLPYQEYFDFCPGNGERPIWHQAGKQLDRYYQLCRQTVEAEDRAGEAPIRVPVLDRWSPSAIPALASHVDWEARWQRLASAPPGKSLAGRALDRMVPAPFAAQMRRLRRFRPADRWAYLTLTRRLRRERAAWRAQLA